MRKNGTLKGEFGDSADKKETPAWAVKFVADMRTHKLDAHMGAELQKVALANVPNDGTDFGKGKAIKTAYQQIMREVQKEMQEHPKDTDLLIKEMGILNQEYRKLALATVGPPTMNDRPRPGNRNRQ